LVTNSFKLGELANKLKNPFYFIRETKALGEEICSSSFKISHQQHDSFYIELVFSMPCLALIYHMLDISSFLSLGTLTL